MSEMRHDPIQGRWVIIAPDRDLRPKDPVSWAPTALEGRDCPFCPGCEAETPPERAVVGRPENMPPNGPGWQMRAFDNRYPALRPGPAGGLRGRDLFEFRSGAGRHEVIVESPEHDLEAGTMGVECLSGVLSFWRDRMEDMYVDESVAHCLIFKNRGPAAGATLSHPHTQMIGAPVVPLAVTVEIENARAWRRSRGSCLFCDILRREEARGDRVILGDEHFIALAPWASRFPAEIQILPRRHASGFPGISQVEIASLAKILGACLRRVGRVLDDADYNLVLHSAPRASDVETYEDYHWHVEILPRLSRMAGFEAGTGFTINPMVPEDAARLLRQSGRE